MAGMVGRGSQGNLLVLFFTAGQDAIGPLGLDGVMQALPLLDTIGDVAYSLGTTAPEQSHLVGFAFGGPASLTMVGSAAYAGRELMPEFQQRCLAASPIFPIR